MSKITTVVLSLLLAVKYGSGYEYKPHLLAHLDTGWDYSTQSAIIKDFAQAVNKCEAVYQSSIFHEPEITLFANIEQNHCMLGLQHRNVGLQGGCMQGLRHEEKCRRSTLAYVELPRRDFHLKALKECLKTEELDKNKHSITVMT